MSYYLDCLKCLVKKCSIRESGLKVRVCSSQNIVKDELAKEALKMNGVLGVAGPIAKEVLKKQPLAG